MESGRIELNNSHNFLQLGAPFCCADVVVDVVVVDVVVVVVVVSERGERRRRWKSKHRQIHVDRVEIVNKKAEIIGEE